MSIDLIGLLKEQASGPLLEKTAALLGEKVDLVEKGILVSSAELLLSIRDKFSSGQGEELFKAFGDGSKLDKLPQHLAGGNQTVTYLSQGLDKSREIFGTHADDNIQKIAETSGLKVFSVSSLLGVVNPMLLGLLGKQKNNNLDVAGFTRLFEMQTDAIQSLANPKDENLAKEVSDETHNVSPIDNTAELIVAKDITQSSNLGFLKWLIPLLLIASAAYVFKDSILEFINSKPKPMQSSNPTAVTTDDSKQEQQVAESFVKLALGIGQHDKNFVDAYHGPEEWKIAAENEQRSLENLTIDANTLLKKIDTLQHKDSARFTLLKKQIIAAQTRIAMVQGQNFTFDEETSRLYDAIAPQYDLAVFDAAVNTIEELIPGDGDIIKRIENFDKQFYIPEDKLKEVFDAAKKLKISQLNL